MRGVQRLVSRMVLAGLSALLSATACCGQPDGREARGKIKVFLMAGQSNMDGRGDGSKLTTEDKARLAEARKHVRLAYNRGEIVPLGVTVPQSHIADKFNLSQTFGPELFFGLDLARAWPDERILMIKRSQGGTSLYGCWNPDWSTVKASAMKEESKPQLYSDLVAYVREVLSSYAEHEYELCGMLWVQGETDSGVAKYGPKPAETYGQNLRQLIRAIRRDTGVEDLPFILLQVGSGAVVEGMHETAQTMRNVTCIPQSNVPDSSTYYPKYGPPTGHYNYAGMRKIGERFADAFLGAYTEPRRTPDHGMGQRVNRDER